MYKFYIRTVIYSEANRYDCVLIACMRRLQHWSLTSIISEFRLLSGPERYFDFEQFIELFDPTSMDILTHVTKGSAHLPEFMAMEYHIRVSFVPIFSFA